MILTIKRSDKSKATPLSEAKEKALASVVSGTNSARERFITPITGQEMTYKEKESQALQWMASETVPLESEGGYGFIFGEVGITADTPTGVAQRILSAADGFRNFIGPAIESARLIANKGIHDSTSTEEVEITLEKFSAVMDAIKL